jgi:adenine deaminase
VKVGKVFKRGELVAEDGELLPLPVEPPKISLRGSVNLKFLTPEDFRIPAKGKKVRAIEIVPQQILTRTHMAEARIVDGFAESDPENDVLKVLIIERHHASDNIGRGFLKGFGLKRGAMASSVSHDSHNIVVTGVNDADMLEAVIEIARMKGGLSIVADGKALGRLPLPIAGLMSEESMGTVKEDLEELGRVAADLGVQVKDPFMALSFISLPVVPELKLTDLGLFDVRRFKFVDVFTD